MRAKSSKQRCPALYFFKVFFFTRERKFVLRSLLNAAREQKIFLQSYYYKYPRFLVLLLASKNR